MWSINFRSLAVFVRQRVHCFHSSSSFRGSFFMVLDTFISHWLIPSFPLQVNGLTLDGVSVEDLGLSFQYSPSSNVYGFQVCSSDLKYLASNDLLASDDVFPVLLRAPSRNRWAFIWIWQVYFVKMRLNVPTEMYEYVVIRMKSVKDIWQKYVQVFLNQTKQCWIISSLGKGLGELCRFCENKLHFWLKGLQFHIKRGRKWSVS